MGEIGGERDLSQLVWRGDWETEVGGDLGEEGEGDRDV